MADITIPLPQDALQIYNRGERQMNKVSIEVPVYSGSGVWPILEEKYMLSIEVDTTNAIVVKADKGGLISLARHLLTLAQDEYPVGSHVHYDDASSLDDGSSPFIVDKVKG